jgi:hypothetical protein
MLCLQLAGVKMGIGCRPGRGTVESARGSTVFERRFSSGGEREFGQRDLLDPDFFFKNQAV